MKAVQRMQALSTLRRKVVGAPAIGGLSERVSRMVYNGFCGYRETAQTGIGYYAEKLRARALES